MPTDLYMPDVKVEIAFNAGYTTASASRTWTDVSAYVELEDQIEINFGRQDERSAADANDLTLTLDNTDGRFTANRSASPYYPNVKVGRPIRVTTIPNANYHVNGGLEVNATGWYSNTVFGTWGTATMARSTTRAHEGTASLLVTWPTHATASQACVNFDAALLTVGQTYTASCWVWVPTGSPDPRIEVVFEGAGARTSLKDQWVYLTYTFTATGTSRQVGVQVLTPTSGQQVYVDEFMVNRGDTALPYTSQLAAISTRFVGFVDEWPVEWDGTAAYARATLKATSRLSRLGLNASLRSMPEEQILASRPIRYWTLGDPPAGSDAVTMGTTTASESSGNNGMALVQGPSINPDTGSDPVVFGEATGPPTDELTAAKFTGGDPSGAPAWRLERYGETTIGTPKGFRFTIKIDAVGTSDWTICVVQTVGGGAPGGMTVRVLTSGVVTVLGMSCGNLNDGLTHDVAVVWPSTTTYLIVDGVQVATGSTASVTTSGTVTYTIWGTVFTGVLSHIAIWNSDNPPSVAIAQGIAATMTAAGLQELSSARLARVAGWAGIAAAEITTETGEALMSYQKTSGSSVIDVLRECESTENGVLFDDRDGDLTFHNQSHRYNRAPAATLDMASQHVGSDYLPRLDRSALANDVTIENPTTGNTARAVDTTSTDEYGIVTKTVTSLDPVEATLTTHADWMLTKYGTPRTRVPSLTVDVLAHQGLTPSAATLLGVTVGDVLAVTNAPTQAESTNQSYFVEGTTERIGPESYTITFNLSPSYPDLDVFQLDSSLLDGTDVLGF